MRKRKKNKANDDGFLKNQAFENQEIIGIDTFACQYSQDSDLQPDVANDEKVNDENIDPGNPAAVAVTGTEEEPQEPDADVSEPLPEHEPEPEPDNLGAVAIVTQTNEPVKSGTSTTVGNTAGFVYDLCYRLGIQSYRYGKRVFVRLARRIMKPVRYAHSLGRFFVLAVDRLLFRSLHAVHEEAHFFRNEIRSSKEYLHQALKESPMSVFSILSHYIKKAFNKHKEMFRTAANLAMPAAAFVVLWLTVTYWNSMTFSLAVANERTGIGYVQDEAVYVKARTLANVQLGDIAVIENSQEQETAVVTAKEDSVLVKAELDIPQYQLALVKLNELSDESALFDNLIEESEQKLTNACGIFVDGAFIGAVKNETDATGVFDSILEPYKTNDTGTIAAFVEDVSFTQGLYSEKTKMMNADELKNILTGKKQEASFHEVRGGETLWDIAIANGKSVDELLALNPGGPDQLIKVGDELKISNEVNFLRVKLIKTETRVADVDFEIVKTDNPNLFRGDTRIIRKGVLGQVSIKELVTYIDGVRVDSEIIEKTVLSEPVAQKVDVGIKSTTVYGAGGSYNVSVSNSGFVWPVPACRSVSSPYGYRSGGFHSGVDIAGSNTRGMIIVAAKDGVVTSVTSGNSLGNYIEISHGNGLKTGYAHCLAGSVSVSPGQRVSAGQAIARVGSTGNSTGPHLHFTVMLNGSKVNPMNYIG